MVKIRVRFRNSGLGFEEQEWERERRNKFVAWFLFEGESEGRS
jgi:RecB family exonuclease